MRLCFVSFRCKDVVLKEQPLQTPEGKRAHTCVLRPRVLRVACGVWSPRRAGEAGHELFLRSMVVGSRRLTVKKMVAV